jgi:RimJ/RimL family protein N-acetyltransferase
MAGFYGHDTPKMAHKGMLWGMYVRPEVRGRGLARRLLEAVLAHAATEVEILQLAVTTDNAAARALYAGLGFVEYGIERRSLKHAGRYWDDVLMAKALG